MPPHSPILVVDDDPETTESLKHTLEENGYPVLVAHDGHDAMRLMVTMTQPPSLVLLDLGMPVMDGWQLLALMRSYVRLARIPVVLVTARRLPPEADAAFEAIVPKPAREDTLMAMVRRWRGVDRTPRS